MNKITAEQLLEGMIKNLQPPGYPILTKEDWDHIIAALRKYEEPKAQWESKSENMHVYADGTSWLGTVSKSNEYQGKWHWHTWHTPIYSGYKDTLEEAKLAVEDITNESGKGTAGTFIVIRTPAPSDY